MCKTSKDIFYNSGVSIIEKKIKIKIKLKLDEFNQRFDFLSRRAIPRYQPKSVLGHKPNFRWYMYMVCLLSFTISRQWSADWNKRKFQTFLFRLEKVIMVLFEVLISVCWLAG